ncbi:agip146 [Agrotis ipsilon multiple nucleopolyhedrovirus]|uniref:Single-stranded DNA binding protein n=1 Tax=Agrotis ipsilon multiple nucleopolyhedrovirus TaxID=208013 RepID=B6D660_9ABAC|nr:agip146 [Agrotis ipsilon multiple nucleopolyhedrovirus]ACI28847.1 single-stranded DNA binding protein [Agrotis ipsilon multiple nucleopolyhedrovirus]
MAKRINAQSIESVVEAKRATVVVDSDETQLTVYNSGGSGDDSDDSYVDNQDVDDKVHHPDDNKMLCVFKTPTIARASKWVDQFRYNLEMKNLTVLRCNTAFNKLFDCMSFLRESLSLEHNISDLLPEVSKDIVIVKPTAPRVVYQVGKHIKGGSMPFYFFDFCKIKRSEGNFGEFFTMSWPKQYMHNEAFARVIVTYKRWECETMKLQNVAYVKLPSNEAYLSKSMFVRKFFDIKQEQNQRNYMTGRLVKSVVCEPFTVERFNSVFKFEKDSKSSAEVEMLVGVQIEGFKQSKEEVHFETVDNKTLQEKTYSLSIKPMVFFHIEE